MIHKRANSNNQAKIIILFFFILACELNLNAQRRHSFEIFVLSSNQQLVRDREFSKLYHNDLLESSTLLTETMLTSFNEHVNTASRLAKCGMMLRSHIPLTSSGHMILDYSIGGGIQKSMLNHFFNDTIQLAYVAEEPGWFLEADLNLLYVLPENFTFSAGIDVGYIQGSLNKVTDLVHGISDHPFLVEDHDNYGSGLLFDLNAGLGYNFQKWTWSVGPLIRLSSFNYFVERIITDIENDDITHEVVNYTYRNRYVFFIQAGANYALRESIDLSMMINYRSNLSIQTSLNIYF
ncbi:MAG: hypothetical protein JXQ80_00775 [Bacteroidales bacterium]|nr:hypothetical protein [Bacteroidales bacterium]